MGECDSSRLGVVVIRCSKVEGFALVAEPGIKLGGYPKKDGGYKRIRLKAT